MKVIFSHGQEGSPWGFKIKRLAVIAEQMDCGVESIDYTNLMEPDARVERLQEVLETQTEPAILVGSSMGGYVSLVASELLETKALFLMAPALYIPSFKQQQHHSLSPKIEIVHGWSDDIIPVSNSVKFAQQANCTLHLIAGDHGLNEVIETVESLFERFLSNVLVKGWGSPR
jgi:surfactin synthase thioesterase subunit